MVEISQEKKEEKKKRGWKLGRKRKYLNRAAKGQRGGEELYNDELDEIYQAGAPTKRKRVSTSSDFFEVSLRKPEERKRRGRPPKALAKVAVSKVAVEEGGKPEAADAEVKDDDSMSEFS